MEPYPIIHADIDIIALANEVLSIHCEKVESDNAAIF